MRGNHFYLEAPGRTQELLNIKWTLQSAGFRIGSTWHRGKEAHRLRHPKITGTREASNSYRLVIYWLSSAGRTSVIVTRQARRISALRLRLLPVPVSTPPLVYRTDAYYGYRMRQVKRTRRRQGGRTVQQSCRGPVEERTGNAAGCS
jgi:hypothetical protein